MHRLRNILYCGLTASLPVFYFKMNNDGLKWKKTPTKQITIKSVPTQLGEMEERKMPYFSQD